MRLCVCARVRAIPGTQAALQNYAEVREQAPKVDTQGQTLLHLIARRRPKSGTLRGMIRGRFGWVAYVGFPPSTWGAHLSSGFGPSFGFFPREAREVLPMRI